MLENEKEALRADVREANERARFAMEEVCRAHKERRVAVQKAEEKACDEIRRAREIYEDVVAQAKEETRRAHDERRASMEKAQAMQHEILLESIRCRNNAYNTHTSQDQVACDGKSEKKAMPTPEPTARRKLDAFWQRWLKPRDAKEECKSNQSNEPAKEQTRDDENSLKQQTNDDETLCKPKKGDANPLSKQKGDDKKPFVRQHPTPLRKRPRAKLSVAPYKKLATTAADEPSGTPLISKPRVSRIPVVVQSLSGEASLRMRKQPDMMKPFAPISQKRKAAGPTLRTPFLPCAVADAEMVFFASDLLFCSSVFRRGMRCCGRRRRSGAIAWCGLARKLHHKQRILDRLRNEPAVTK